MNLLSMFNKTDNDKISVISNPFTKESVSSISIYYRKWSGGNYWYSRVEFENGNTKGEQRTPECATFEEVIIHLKQVLESIK